MIDPDIRKASTLPGSFYREAGRFEQAKERIWARAWHYIGDAADYANANHAYPFEMLPGVLGEPLVLTTDRSGHRRCLSNVCTHRGKIIVEAPGPMRQLACGYHGRCFRLDGSFKSMPAFEGAANFPTPEDDLPALPLEHWAGLLFTSLRPFASLETAIAPMKERVQFLPLNQLQYVAADSQDHYVQAHWALYCDNYLEGFHVPFVHPALNTALDVEAYDYETFEWCNLQIGIAQPEEPAFDLPEGHPDYGRRVYAYYFFLFPNLMFNFYPWGLSLNVVEPLSLNQTRVRFRSYAFPGTAFNRADNNIDETELEDEAVVESVQKGIQSRLYQRGRFSPAMEPCVHHFHRLISQAMELY